MKQRVLFAIYEMSGGGSQRQILGILTHLDRERFEPELYIVFDHGELLSEVPADVPVHIFERRNTAKIGKLPGAGFRLRARDLASVLDERQIHVIYDRTYHMTMLTAAATRLRPTPRISVIVTDPKLDFETNPEKFRMIKRRLLRNSYRDADIVAAVSDGVRIAAADYHRIPLNRIETVYNFYDVDQIDRMSREKLPGKDERSKDHFRVVAAGRLHRQKGFDVLIEAARKVVYEYGHQQLSLVILGTGESRSQFEVQIREARLQDHVRLAGFHINPLP
ncbi:MAG: glycosyltransferase, partial [Planctomycetaceae bacterium]|nr:glycosyltransferase [Planctomycetaceae bacterium]